MLQRSGLCGSAAMDVELGEDVPCAGARRVNAHLHKVGDFLGGKTFYKELQKIVLKPFTQNSEIDGRYSARKLHSGWLPPTPCSLKKNHPISLFRFNSAC
jgi:hypothetical protein